MRSFKNIAKALLVSVAFLLMSVIIFELFCAPYFYGTAYYYQDGKVRDDLAGSLDFLICGASQAQRGISPTVLDRELGCNSYNLSTPLLSMESKYIFLKKELKRNPVKTVIIELCYDTVARDRGEVGPEGDHYAIGRFTNPIERYGYLLSSARIGEYGEILNEAMNRSIKATERNKKGEGEQAIRHYEDKGFTSLSAAAIELPAKENWFKEEIDTDVSEQNLEYLDKMIELCKSYGAEVIVVSTPLSNVAILSYDALDTIQTLYADICKKHGVPFCNYSLYKGKTELFPDATAYYDRNHLSDSGAEDFSALLAQTVKSYRAGEDIASLFYGSYSELCRKEIFTTVN